MLIPGIMFADYGTKGGRESQADRTGGLYRKGMRDYDRLMQKT